MICRLRHYADTVYRMLNYSRAVFDRRRQTANRFILNFDLNDGCNINCVMCCKKNSYASQKYIPIENFAANIAGIFRMVDDFQCGCQFEPLMYPHFLRAVQIISEHLKPGVRGDLICNGTLLIKEKRDILLQSGIFKKIRISFDGATKNTFEMIRRGANFDTVVEHVAALASERTALGVDISIEFNCTVMEQNVSELPAIVKLAASLGLDSVTTHKLFPHDYGLINATYHDELLASMHEASEAAAGLGLQFSGQVYTSKKTIVTASAVKSSRCGFMDQPLLLILSADGMLRTPCRQVFSSLGNLLNEDFDAIRNSRKFGYMLNFFSSPHAPICKGCYMFKAC